MTNNSGTESDSQVDVIWGVQEIARRIKRTDRQTFHMLAEGHLPGKKVGGRWCTTESALNAFFREIAA